jgi:hypothetical protein
MNIRTSFLQQLKDAPDFPVCSVFVSRCLVALRTMEIPPLLYCLLFILFCLSLSLNLMLRPTVSRPVCLVIKHSSVAYDQIFIIVSQLRVCWFGAPSLTRWRLCRLPLLLVLASAVIFGSESRRTHGHILLSQIRDFSFRRLLRLAGSRWRYSTPPPHGFCFASGWFTLCNLGADRKGITGFYSSVNVSYQSVSTGTWLLSRCVAADGS